MSDPKKKCRQYNVEYLKYGFIQSPSNKALPMCLICQRVFSNEAMKPSRLQEHLTKIHPDRKDRNLSYFEMLKEQHFKRPTLASIFSAASKQDDDGLRASYNISLLIAKSGKPHTIGEELILPAVSEVLRTVLHKPASDIIKKIPLSNNTVQRRIDEMSEDVERSLTDYLKTSEFSLQLDESTLPNNESLLLAYVRFIKSEKICQELLFVRTLETDTKGKSIFDVLEHYFTDKGIPLENVITVATDGAPAMVGRHRGLIAYLKKAVPSILAVHCVIHRQHLVAKNLGNRLHCSLQYVITAVNKIRSSALNDRLFRKLCDENDENFNRLLLHTEVRWLSKGTCLKRFYDLFDSVLEFFESKDDSLRDNLLKFKSDIAYLTDLYDKFNETNLQLQGDNLNLIKAKGTISSFVSKLNLYRQNLGRRQFHQFQNLSSVETNDEDILVYCQHLEALQEDFRNRFQDILGLIIPDWVLEPFSSLETAELSLQEELIELSTNEELKVKFKNGYQEFWLQCQISVLYPALWAASKKFFIAFPSSYLAERGFSIVSNLLTKKRNRLSIVERGDLRLLMTSMEPNIDRLLSLHQAQPSH